MTRLIERWFPCAEVSRASMSGWGSGNYESSLWVWFAKRPTVQAKAAVLTSLLPWPEDEEEQRKLRDLVCRALKGRAAAQDAVAARLADLYPKRARVLDPFSGRAMIPLEAGRLGTRAFGIDYSPFATLGGWLLATVPFTDWSAEPRVPFASNDLDEGLFDRGKAVTNNGKADDNLVADVEAFLAEVGRRYTDAMADFYPQVDGKYPWGYVWASTLPCQECGNRFPLVGELRLRLPRTTRNGRDVGQSFRIGADRVRGGFHVVVHEGLPTGSPTRVLAGKHKYASEGKVAVCPFCGHTHPKAVHTRLSKQGLRQDALLAAADIAPDGTKVFREPSAAEVEAADRAAKALGAESPFGILSARPDERIPPGNTRTIQSVNYGDYTYGDLCEARQTLGLVRLARAINHVSVDCMAAGLSATYVRALAGYATAVLMRKIRRSTRGARLQITGGTRVGDIFVNQSAVTVSYDWFESGLSDGPGSWASLADQTVTTLRNVRTRAPARPAEITRGTATNLPFADASVDAIITDPPYDDMIDYSDSSDLFYIWAKRAMMAADPAFSLTLHPNGVQEKSDEIIIKRGGGQASDHRTKDHYSAMIERAYADAARVVSADGVVTIVFGHGDLDVWHRMLNSLAKAQLVLTGSWPAKTEAGGGGAGSANIAVTVTMACRRAPEGRKEGRLAAVESQIRAEIKNRMGLWERSGLATTDMLMASAGPAMEVVGRYTCVRDARGEIIKLKRFLLTGRQAVQECCAIKIDTVPLEAFDDRTRFVLWWVQLYGRQLTAKSELRNEIMAAGLDPSDVKNVIRQEAKGCKLALADQVRSTVGMESGVIDIVLAMAREKPGGIDPVGDVLAAAGRAGADEQVWAVITFFDNRLCHPDPDAAAWTWMLRYREMIQNAARTATPHRRVRVTKRGDQQDALF